MYNTLWSSGHGGWHRLICVLWGEGLSPAQSTHLCSAIYQVWEWHRQHHLPASSANNAIPADSLYSTKQSATATVTNVTTTAEMTLTKDSTPGATIGSQKTPGPSGSGAWGMCISPTWATTPPLPAVLQQIHQPQQATTGTTTRWQHSKELQQQPQQLLHLLEVPATWPLVAAAAATAAAAAATAAAAAEGTAEASSEAAAQPKAAAAAIGQQPERAGEEGAHPPKGPPGGRRPPTLRRS